MRTLKKMTRRNFGSVFFIFPYSEIKNELQDYFAQSKTFCRIKKIFFPKYPRHLLFYLGKNTKSIVRLCGEETPGKASTPGKNSEPRMGGEALVCHNQKPYKKSLCKLTKKNNKKISLNPLTNTVPCAIIQIQRTKEHSKGDNYYDAHL